VINPWTFVYPQTPEEYTYDADGNLTADGQWTYTYDGENRLIGMETTSSAVEAGVAKVKLEFIYDYMGRRVKKSFWTWDATHYDYTSGQKFLYDGWRLVAELSENNTPTRKYVWGLDLSGTLQGAGGIGGLAMLVQQLGTEAATAIYFPAFDGNGNVTTLVNSDGGAVEAKYDYSPFGKVLTMTGSYAETNPMRFSTKYTDAETDLAYFGYRYYNPDTGRWLNRDPMEEKAFKVPSDRNGKGLRESNLYNFVRNNPSRRVDPLGLRDCSCGANLTDAIVGHLNDFISQAQGNLNPIWYFGTDVLRNAARANGPAIRNAATGIGGCAAPYRVHSLFATCVFPVTISITS